MGIFDFITNMKGDVKVVEECIRMREAWVEGMWLMPKVPVSGFGVWDGVFFCRMGPMAPSVVRFVIDGNVVILFNGEILNAPYTLLNEPLQLQQWIKAQIESGHVQFDPLQTLTYQSLFAHNDNCAIHFKDKKALSELDEMLKVTQIES